MFFLHMIPDSDNNEPHKGFYTRGYLPHFDEPGLIQSITFRLKDSLKPGRAYELQHGKQMEEVQLLFSSLDDDLDKGYGKCWLANPEIGRLVEQSMQHFHNERYRPLCWVIMPNHVHCIIQQIEGYSLSAIVRSWKSFSAVQANRILGRSGPFWQEDYFDRFVRNRSQLAAAASYIHYNPVAAGLCKTMEDWQLSSFRIYKEHITRTGKSSAFRYS